MPAHLRAALAAALVSLALPSSALANATVTRDSFTDYVTVTSTATEINDIAVSDSGGLLRIQEQHPLVAGLDAGSGCSTVSAKVVTCGSTVTVVAIIANLGPSNDLFRSSSDASKDIPR